jgi:uncharacterized membrane protein YdfJ with MMPL/SSD domain
MARIADLSTRRPRLVLLAWFALVVGPVVVSGILGGQRMLASLDGGPATGESALGRAALAAAGSGGSLERFALVVSNPAGSLDTPAGRVAVREIADALDAATANLGGLETAVFTPDPSLGGRSVIDPFDLAKRDPAAGALVIAANHGTVRLGAGISGTAAEIEAKTAGLRAVLADLRVAHPDLRLLALSRSLLVVDSAEYAGGTTGGLLLLTLPLTFLILLVAFRAAVAAVIPLVLGAGTIVGAMGLVGLYSHVIGPVSPFAVEFVVLIGLAVAVDYSLFVVTRFRTELAAGLERTAALETALATAGRAVLFSGIAVVASMGSLFLLGDAMLAGFALGAIAAVAVTLLGTLTFLPAILGILDRRIERGRLPLLALASGHGAGDADGLWARISRTATGHAVPVVLGATAVLVLAALPLVGVHLGATGGDLSTMPPSLEGVQAARLMDETWPAGASATLDVIVTKASEPATQAALERLPAMVLAIPGVGGPVQTSFSADGSVASASFVLHGGPNDQANLEAVRRVRAGVLPEVFGALSGVRAYVSGGAADALDYTDYYAERTLAVLGFVLALSFLLLLLTFHSIVVPIKAIVLNLLSVGATLGILTVVFQDGWFGRPAGATASPVDASTPVMVFAILFGLSMDYHVFILMRIREARDRGLPTTDAIVTGITATAGTVTSAAAIMVCVFAGFCAIQILNIQEFGFGLAVAIVIDATVVRSLLLPASMRLLGDWNWWLPGFLRWLPRLEPGREVGTAESAA